MAECSACQRKIIEGKDYNTGRTVYVEFCKKVYREFGMQEHYLPLIVEQVKSEQIYIPHSLTCRGNIK